MRIICMLILGLKRVNLVRDKYLLLFFLSIFNFLGKQFVFLVIYQTNIKGAFFYSQFWNENGQNVKYARFFIPHSYS